MQSEILSFCLFSSRDRYAVESVIRLYDLPQMEGNGRFPFDCNVTEHYIGNADGSDVSEINVCASLYDEDNRFPLSECNE